MPIRKPAAGLSPSTEPAASPTFHKFKNLPLELQQKVLTHALPKLAQPVTARVHNTFKEQVEQLQRVSKDFWINVRYMYFSDNTFKLVYRRPHVREGDYWYRAEWIDCLALRQFRVPNAAFSQYVQILEIHLPIPQEANNATSVTNLLQVCPGLQHLFVDKTQHRNAPQWQPRFTRSSMAAALHSLGANAGRLCSGGMLRGPAERSVESLAPGSDYSPPPFL